MKKQDLLKVRGGKPLHGTFSLVGNKNSVFPLVAAAAMCTGPIHLRNVPIIGDVDFMNTALESIGITCSFDHGELIVDGSLRDIVQSDDFAESAKHIRASLLFAPMLFLRTGEKVFFPFPGGDRIGSRPLDVHFYVLREMGVEVTFVENGFFLDPHNLHSSNLWLSEPSVTGTELAILMAASIKGKTQIRNYALEPHVEDLCRFLRECGVSIENNGPGSIFIESSGILDHQRGSTFCLGYDFMEMSSIIASVSLAGGDVFIVGWNGQSNSYADPELMIRLYKELGVDVKAFYDRGVIQVKSDRDFVVPNSSIRIKPGPWPSLNTDIIPPALAVAAIAKGETYVHEWMFDGRLHWLEQLRHMGAQVEVLNRHEAIIQGVPQLVASRNTIESPDIRSGMAILAAALGAEGETLLTAKQIDRGYEAIDVRLNALGAEIVRKPIDVG